MTDSIETRVARGVALLDSEIPGWDRRVNAGTLDMASRWDDVLGQLFDSYDAGARELLNDPDSEAVEYGFNTYGGFQELTTEWRRVILARREEADR